MPKAKSATAEIEYETFGADTAPAVLLINGLGSQMTRWPADFDHTAAGVVHTDDPGPEPSPLLQPPGMTWQAPPLRSTP